MDWLRRLRFKLRALRHDRVLEADVVEEMREHVERLVARYVASGMALDDARRAARRQFGNVASLQEDARDARRFAWLEQVRQDLAYAWRQLRRNPGFALTATLSLALGIGASVAIFSAVNAILIRDLPLPHAERLAVLRKGARGGLPDRGVAPAEVLEIAERLQPLAAVAPFATAEFVVRRPSSAERIWGLRVAPAFFSTLDVAPALGRDFLPADDRYETERVAIISASLWRREFASDPRVLGQRLDVGTEHLTIVGVMPDSFRFPPGLGPSVNPEIWVPLAFHRNEAIVRGAGYMFAMVRRHAHVTWDGVQRALDDMSKEYEARQPTAYGNQELRAMPAHEEVVGRTRPMLLLLWASVTCLLLIACANTANVVLSRTASRARELAVRASIGASRRRLFTQLVTESLLLAGFSAAGGLALAASTTAFARRALAEWLPRADEIGIDWRVLVFTIGLAVLTCLIVGLLPALRLSAATPRDAMSAGGSRSTTDGPWTSRLRRLLLVAQIALAIALGTTAALLGRSLSAAVRADLGFRPDALLTFELSIADRTMARPAAAALYERLAAQLVTHPQIASAGALSFVPLSGADFGWTFLAADRPVAPGAALPHAGVRMVTPGAFEALAVPMRAGRVFRSSDGAGAPPVAIVSETFARQTWSGESAIGKQIKLAGPIAALPWMTVVGVAADVRFDAPDRAGGAMIYRPQAQHGWRDMAMVVRTSAPYEQVVPLIREDVAQLGGSVSVLAIREFAFYLSRSVADRRLLTSLVSVFAAMALVIALVGVFGVFAYAVTSRTREIGVRLALGAGRGRVVWMVMREALGISAVGVVVAAAALFAARRLIESQLYEVRVMDVPSLGLISAVVVLTALLACSWPAHRAAAVDPTLALRAD